MRLPMIGTGIGFEDALRPLSRLREDIQRAFEGFDLPTYRVVGVGYPALNTWEDDNNAYVEAELPGVRMDQLGVSVTGATLSIQGKRESSAPQGATCLRNERPTGAFARAIELPWDVDAEKVEASLRDGVLTVKLPKAESAKPRKVKVVTA